MDTISLGEKLIRNNHSLGRITYFELVLSKYNSELYKGTTDFKGQLDASDDAAHTTWGGDWRMPTIAEFSDLKNNCNWSWTSIEGTSGYLVTSKRNGKSIFLPATGIFEDTSKQYPGVDGNYWSSSHETFISSDNQRRSVALTFNPSGVYIGHAAKLYGMTIRPVIK